MSEPLIFEWDGPGYDMFRKPKPSAVERASDDRDDWELLHRAVAAARHGDRSIIAELPAACARATHVAFHSTACQLIADGGDARALEALLPMLESDTFEFGLHAALALIARGRLVDAPAVFYFYELHQGVKDASILESLLDEWLCEPDEWFTPAERGDDPYRRTWQDYRRQVGRRYFALWNELGTNLVHIHRGGLLDIERLIRGILKDLKTDGDVAFGDRHIFEATTGVSCSHWFRPTGGTNTLRVAADLERFLQSGKAAAFPPGQRAFMGHPLEDVRAAADLLSAYPPNHGMGVPYVRTTFDIDVDFELEYGFKRLGTGYFYRSPMPPPTATLAPGSQMPWVGLHVALRDAKRGDRRALGVLATLLKPGVEGTLMQTMAELLGVAADRPQIAHWQHEIETSVDAEYALTLCRGLVFRGVLSDVPLILSACQRFRAHPEASAVRNLLNYMFAYVPMVPEFTGNPDMDAFCSDLMQRYRRLTNEIGSDHVPVSRGRVLSVQGVAREIIERQSGSFLIDLRDHFERATGIECTHWIVRDGQRFVGFDQDRAAADARQFLDSPSAAGYEPARLYFFGHVLIH